RQELGYRTGRPHDPSILQAEARGTCVPTTPNVTYAVTIGWAWKATLLGATGNPSFIDACFSCWCPWPWRRYRWSPAATAAARRLPPKRRAPPHLRRRRALRW